MPDLRKVSIHITGIVQGVGFRPFIYGLAVRHQLNGWVRNSSAGVDIEVDGDPETLDAFIVEIKAELPPLARIDSLEVKFSKPRGFTGFEIVESEEVEGAFQPISPDVCICENCLQELFDPNDRRYHYPFINCTNCGPRFTIITDIPYDRPNTTMAGFTMCTNCAREYKDPLDRRFHAQPVACPECGPKVWLELKGQDEKEGQKTEGDEAIEKAQQLLAEGKILAIKGLEGFHLACDATNTAAVDELRRRKLRVDKPFALMVADLKTAEANCEVSEQERSILESRQRPIVLLEKKPGSTVCEGVAPKQHRLGIMLPYTPLQYLLFRLGDPRFTILVMTSGNLSEEPIATGNQEARERLSDLADGFLMNDRDIETRCDDSVVEQFGKDIYYLRRSRGYAPDPIQLPFAVPALLATGPELKNTFCLTRDQYAFVSHHIGDMENYETKKSFEEGVEHFERLFRIRPEGVAYDLHPNYLSTQYALERAEAEKLPAIGVQHHYAHIAACMADNGVENDHPVIGVAFDGTGYGEDGTIWGGEFLVADYSQYKRLYHLDYFPLPGGDAAIKRPARTALALLWSLGMEWDELLEPTQSLCFEEQMALRIQMEKSLNTVPTSSMGRLFDAAAALAGIRQKVNYEAQAAIEFEALIDEQDSGAYDFEITREGISPKKAIQELMTEIREGVTAPRLSAHFHNGVARMVSDVCVKITAETGLREVALSGGVWQNLALLKRTRDGLRGKGFTVYLHHRVPPNDGGISLGQAMVAANQLIAKS